MKACLVESSVRGLEGGRRELFAGRGGRSSRFNGTRSCISLGGNSGIADNGRLFVSVGVDVDFLSLMHRRGALGAWILLDPRSSGLSLVSKAVCDFSGVDLRP